jgi:CRISPR-associated protein Cmr5
VRDKKVIENLIPKAMELLEKEFDIKNKGGVPKELKGYISNFGASIIQSGLIPAVAFYEREKTNNNDDVAINRRKLMRVIGNLIGYDLKSKDDILLEKLMKENEVDLKIKKKDIINASIAVKLAIRVYKQIDGNEKIGDKDE